MMRCVMSMVVALVMLVPCWADEKPKAATTTGVVKALDVSKKTLTLQGKKKEKGPMDPDVTVALASDVKVTLGEKAATLSDVKVGGTVTLTLTADKKTATAIAIAVKKPENKEKGEKENPKAKMFGGEVTKVEGDKVTVTRKGDKGEQSETFTVGAKTKILVETAEDVTVTGEGGKTSTKPKTKEGTKSDLKTGLRVTVQAPEQADATQITVLRPAAKKPNKEGEK